MDVRVESRGARGVGLVGVGEESGSHPKRQYQAYAQRKEASK
jgi:hypothetical protein